jgi:hypothetical protein
MLESQSVPQRQRLNLVENKQYVMSGGHCRIPA